MANERDLELLDDYIANRMSENDRSAFEQKLNADPNLHQEYVLQKRLIQGIKDARVAQLKSMLNQVPVPSQGPGTAIASKVVIATVVTLMIGAASYWFIKNDQTEVADQSAPRTGQQLPKENSVTTPAETEVKAEEKQPATRKQQVQETDKNQTSAGTEHSKPSLAKKPDPLAAPAAKNGGQNREAVSGDASATKSPVSIDTQSGNDTYTFHYQYRDGKVTLYGPFESKEYQVIEMPLQGKTTAFLFYGNQYYSLDKGSNEVKPLTPVGDASLTRQLEEYRRSQ